MTKYVKSAALISFIILIGFILVKGLTKDINFSGIPVPEFSGMSLGIPLSVLIMTVIVIIAGAIGLKHSKGGSRHVTTLLVIVAILGCLIFLFTGKDPIDYIREKGTSDATVTAPAGARTIQLAQWQSRTSDGSIPLGVWSKSDNIVGCSVRFGAGNGKTYRVRFSLDGVNWKIHPADGSETSGDYISFKAVKPLTKIPYTKRCY